MRTAYIFIASLFLAFSSAAQNNATQYVTNLRNNNPNYYSGFKGNFLVTETGAAVYNIPIFVPPGVAGMEPKVSLVYNSDNGTSILGDQWALSGLSIIGRSPATINQDGFVNPVNFDEFDKLHLDGQRLIAVDTANDYGGQNTYYRTENNTYKEIFINEGELNPRSNSLKSFIVKSRDGLIYRYGNASVGGNEGIVYTRVTLPNGQDEDFPILWLLRTITDRNGNWIRFDYQIGPNSYYPSKIFYGKANEAVPVGSIEFEYKQPLWWVNKKYVNGQEIILNKYINEIRCNQITKNGAVEVTTLVRKYILTYDEDQNFKRVFLTGVYQGLKENVRIDNTTVPKDDISNKISFRWAKPFLDSTYFQKTVKLQESIAVDERAKLIVGDFNGDGYPDRILLDNLNDSIRILYSENDRKNKFKKVALTGFRYSIPNNYKQTSGDFNADGRPDIFISYFDVDSLKSLVVYLEKDAATRKDVFHLTQVNQLGAYPSVDKKKITIVPGEFNGDGYSDLLVYYITDSIRYIPVTVASGFNFSVNKAIAISKDDIPDDTHLFFNDLNGDGLNDFLFSWTNANGWYLKSYVFPDSRSFGVQLNEKITYNNEALNRRFEANYEGEVITRSDGGKDSALKQTLFTIANGDYSKIKNIFVVDFTKDGNADIIISKADRDGWHIYPAIGKGNGEFEALGKIKLSSEKFNTDLRTSFGDFNGDGVLDLVILYSNSEGWFYNVAYGNGKGNFYCKNKSGDTKVTKLVNENFSYSYKIPSISILPPDCFFYYPLIAQQLGEPVPDAYDGYGYYAYLDMFRRGRYVETGFYPTAVDKPYLKEVFSCPGRLFIESVNYENNIKLVESVKPIPDSVVVRGGRAINNFDYYYWSRVTLMDYWQSFVIDFNADGVSDLMLTYPNNPESDTALHLPLDPLNNKLTAFVAINSKDRTGQMNLIAHSNKNQINIQYESHLVNEKTLDTIWRYPYVKLTNPHNCVRRVGITNGINKDSLTYMSYSFSNGIVDVNGHGFIGFLTTYIKDESTGIFQKKDYDDSPRFMEKGLLPLKYSSSFIGARKGDAISNEPIEFDSYEYELRTFPSSGYFNFYVTGRSSVARDLFGLTLSVKKSATSYDDFGNAVTIEETTGTGQNIRTKKVENTYYESADSNLQKAWILGRLKDTRVIVNRTDTSISNFAYDFQLDADENVIGSGQLVNEVVWVNRPELSITKNYAINRYGNIDSSYVFPTQRPRDVRTTQTAYSTDQRFIISTTDPENYISTQKYDISSGLLLFKTKNEGTYKTSYVSDPLGRKAQITDADTLVTQTELRICRNCEVPNATTFVIESNSNSSVPTVHYYDNAGHKVKKVTFDFKAEKKICIDYKYDNRGNLIALSSPYFENQQPAWSRFDYDILNRQTEITLPDASQIIHRFYGLTDTLVNAKGSHYITVKNIFGDVDSTYDPNGFYVSYRYDGFGRLIEIKDQNNNFKEYRYDANGNKNYYNTSNFKHPVITSYDCWGQRVSETNANGATKTFEYDKIGRIVKIKTSEGDIVYKYIPFNSPLAGKGKVYDISSNSYTHWLNEKIEYYVSGRIKTHVYLVKQGTDLYDPAYKKKDTLRYSFTYSKGLLSSITYPYNGLKEDRKFLVKYNYQNGILVTAKADTGNVNNLLPVYQLNEMTAWGTPSQYKMGDSIIAKQDFDPVTTRLLSLNYWVSDSLITGMNYQYDAAGNVTVRQDAVNPSLTDSISYDALNRVTAVKTDKYIVGAAYYDNGDLKKKNYGQEHSFDFTYQPNTNKLDLVMEYEGANDRTPTRYNLKNEYDDYGNLTATFPCINRYNRLPIAFNEYNEIKNVGFHKFYYGFEGEQQVVSRQNDIYLFTPLSEIYFDLNETRQFRNQKFSIIINDLTVAYYYSSDNSIHYVLRDGQNSIIGQISKRGKKENREFYNMDIWGLRRDAASWKYDWKDIEDQYNKADNKGFLNAMSLEGFGLVGLGVRMYDPILGRFISIDPIINLSYPGNQALNPYAYAINNPITFRDPNGSIFGIDDIIVVAVVAAYIGASASGGSFLPWEWNENWWKGALVGAASAFGGYYLGGVLAAGGPVAAGMGGGFGSAFAGAFTSTIVNGGNLGQAFENGFSAGVIGGVTGAFTGFIGHGIPGLESPEAFSYQHFIKAGAHGLVQGLYSEATEGSFSHGFMSGASIELVQPIYGTSAFQNVGMQGQIIMSAIVGGTVAEIGGGKFANGAITGAMVQTLNHGNTTDIKSRKELLDEMQKKNELTHDAVETFVKISKTEAPAFLKQLEHANIAGSAFLGAYEVMVERQNPWMVMGCGAAGLGIGLGLGTVITPVGGFIVGNAVEQGCKYFWPEKYKTW